MEFLYFLLPAGYSSAMTVCLPTGYAIQPSGVWFRVFYCEPRPIWVSALTWVVSKGDEAGIQKQKLLWATKKEKKKTPHQIDIGNKNIDWREIFLWIAHFLCIFWTDLNQF